MFVMVKIALCFIISREHIVNKENIWKDWIEINKDIINVYFYFSDYSKIKSSWVKKNCIPKDQIKKVSYYHMIPAYFILMNYAYHKDKSNNWFCFLTDSCTPIIHPLIFRKMFYENLHKSIIKWDYPDWNINLHKRANLHLLSNNYRLKNTPYFILSRKNVLDNLEFMKKNRDIFINISNGVIANESLFAIIIKYSGDINNVINKNSTITDWSRMSSPTSPYLFTEDNEENRKIIAFNKTNYSFFLRKVHTDFPDNALKKIIYCENYYHIKYIQILCFFYKLLYTIKRHKNHILILFLLLVFRSL